MGQAGAQQCANRGAQQAVAPEGGVEQLAAVEGVAGGGCAKGGAQLVGAQYQVGRQAGSQQGRDGQQATAAGNGIDKTGDKSHQG